MPEPSIPRPRRPGLWGRLSLFWKLIIAFALVIVIGLVGALVAVGSSTAVEFRQFARSSEASRWQGLADELGAYYATHGSWQGAESVLQQGRGRGAGVPRVIVVDSQGKVVIDETGGQLGRTISEQRIAAGVPIFAESERVGTLLPPPSALTAAEQLFLNRTRTLLIASGAAALVVAMLLGALLARNIAHPLRQLATATHAVAAGHLETRVPVRSTDEVGELAADFNQMAQELADAEEARRQQAADIAHELRTPLTVIQGQLEALADGIFPADAEHLAPALKQAHVLALLIEDLRTLSLAEAGRLTLHPVSTDLKEWAINVVRGFLTTATERGISLQTEAADGLPQVMIDRGRMAQVLGNLLSNALRHTPEGGQISLQIVRAESSDQVIISLDDTGPGVPPEHLERIFERFWRAEPSRSRRTGGSGLGLAIARRIVEAHGGHIWAENAPGGGLRVAFTLPASP